VVDRHRAITHNPTVALARAIRLRVRVRITLRSSAEHLPSESVEGWVLRFEGDPVAPTRVVVGARREPAPDAAQRVVPIDRVARVEELPDLDAARERETQPPPPDPARRTDPDATLRIEGVQLQRRPK
jgi:hypothetical protein